MSQKPPHLKFNYCFSFFRKKKSLLFSNLVEYSGMPRGLNLDPRVIEFSFLFGKIRRAEQKLAFSLTIPHNLIAMCFRPCWIIMSHFHIQTSTHMTPHAIHRIVPPPTICPNLYFESLTPNVMKFADEAVWVIRLDEVTGVGPSWQNYCPYNNRHQRSCSLCISALWEHSEKVTIHEPGTESSPNPTKLVLWSQT